MECPTRRRSTFRIACLLLGGYFVPFLCVGLAVLPAQDGDLFPARSMAATPLQDDATLHDVQFVGTETGWAVGDHGVIWNTTNGGLTWELQASGVKASLRSACFLTDRVGWIVGGESLPYVQQGLGIVLKTSDGGTTWEQLAGKPNETSVVPELHRVKFFSLTHGIAAGESGAVCPTGIVITSDGGKTWQPAAGDASGSWRAADFINPEIGAVAGQRGQRALFGDSRLISSKLGGLGLRGLHALKLFPNGSGWLVGDGGLVLQIAEKATIWQAPKQGFAREVRDLFDFKAIAARGDHVWITGDPGSVIWHSPDRGQNWERQLTRQTLPLRAICFPTEDLGWAVGELGIMLQTTDGGETWLAARGAERRVAYLTAQGSVERVSIPMVTAVSGENGFRGLVTVLSRSDLARAGDGSRELDLKLSEATMLAGGSSAQMSWRLPLEIPGLENDPAKLLAEWSKRSEGALKDVLIAQYVRQIRTWRPSVVVIDEPEPKDALGRLIKLVVVQAVQQAADPTSQLVQQEIADLPEWKVDRIFIRLPSGYQGQVNIGAHDLLSRQGCSIMTAATPALARMKADPYAVETRESYRVLASDGGVEEYRGTDFFAGLGLNPGSETRRELPATDEDQFELQKKLADRQRNFENYKKTALRDHQQSNNLIGQLQDITRGMSSAQAVLLMGQLADDYRRRGQWELAEATLVEMVERFPHEPAAQDAMRWLLQLWVSNEMTYRRVRATHVSHQRISADTKDLIQRLRNAGQPQAETNEATLNEEILQASGQSESLNVEDLPFKITTGKEGDLRQQKADLWQEKALWMAKQIRRSSPAWHQTPGIQFPLGSLHRQRHASGPAAECYHLMMREREDSPWHKTAMTELWLNHSAGVPPKQFYTCRSIAEVPQLDGILTDPCWQTAEELPLNSEQPNGPLKDPAFVLICHDEEYLYLGGMCPRIPGAATDLPSRKGRQHDSDVSPYDRITVLLDVDRDYTTFYRFTIDQRGWTAEDLWGDITWNPNWFVAAEGDEQGWRFEAAIPWKELVPSPPASGTVWAASVQRTVPAIGTQGWTHPVSTLPKLETGGLFKIE